jgi:hypothetical protein
VSITKGVVFFTLVPTKFSLHFSEFSTNFYAFYNYCKRSTLLKMHLCYQAPGKKLGLAFGSLDHGRRRRRPNSGGPAALPVGERLGRGLNVTSLVLTCIQNVEFQKLELKWSARLSMKIVLLFPSPKFLDLILDSTIPLGFKPC